MRFLIDTQLPLALTAWLNERGHFAEHVLDLGLAQGKDNQLWLYALERGAVILTKDEDFAEWVRQRRPGPQIVWLRLGNSTKRALLDWLAGVWPGVIRDLQKGTRLIEVR